VVKAAKSPTPPPSVRTRRAYFDCAFGQLHVRTAFPTTGGFDEQVTLFCLHPIDSSSRVFGGLLPALADVRSVYAPDLPGYGESDASPGLSSTDAATAISDLANGLRLRQIDLFGINFGATVALELAAARPELVRRLVLSGVASAERPAAVKQQQCTVDAAGFGEHPSEDFIRDIARQIDKFLSARGSSP
jgi:pimeloyl-ACP methyl ester carboxylesterase